MLTCNAGSFNYGFRCALLFSVEKKHGLLVFLALSIVLHTFTLVNAARCLVGTEAGNNAISNILG